MEIHSNTYWKNDANGAIIRVLFIGGGRAFYSFNGGNAIWSSKKKLEEILKDYRKLDD